MIAFVAAVFSMQGIGILAAAAVSIFITLIFQAANPGGPYDKHSVHGIKASVSDLADYVWRIQVSRVSALSRQLTVFSPSLQLAFGAIPAILTLHARAMMPETSRYTLRVEGDAIKASMDAAEYSGQEISKAIAPPTAPPMSSRQFLRKFWRPLLGCCGAWFFLDIAFYSQNLFQKACVRIVCTTLTLHTGCLLRNWLDSARRHHERPRRALSRGARAGHHRSGQHRPWLLLHRASTRESWTPQRLSSCCLRSSRSIAGAERPSSSWGLH